ncbi:hypothetical protein JOD43_003990 [Pullulanibacillus pueri]|uniref:Uncharacterized protein n=1 Tax=Pullulanibacillus pueri TaxID=1437324 RepID=A0A8J2ZZ00_9BACL|nr:hypothetical protein [Pullulanibacillus pueri]MBM7683809.1 hypothetical protein [Pullulanibacillus pueri]GGH87661.1 hypothetical protein GCM10007096_38190 [Pullulanibacillus pueri]
MENQSGHSLKLNFANDQGQAIDDIKSSFQSQSVVLNELLHPFFRSMYSQFDFEQFLIDRDGNYWFIEKNNMYKQTTQIYIFNHKGDLLKNFAVKGKPTLYEKEYLMIAACEGTDDKGHIYSFCKHHLNFIEEWTIDGFLWDMECIGETFYVTSYFVESNEAVLYILNNDKKTVVSLGHDMFPTGILCHKNKLFIALSYLRDGNKGKVIQCGLDGQVVKEIAVEIAPRKLFGYKNELVICGLDMAKGYSDRLVYINLETGKQTTFQLPQAMDVRAQDKHLLFYNGQTESIIYWSHEKRKIMRVVRWPGRQSSENKLEALGLNH